MSNDLENLEKSGNFVEPGKIRGKSGNFIEFKKNQGKSGNFIEFKKNQGEIREFRDSSWKNHNLTFIGLILTGLMEFPASLLKKFLT